MSSAKRWVQQGGSGGGQFYKWENDGQELQGVWRGQRDGKYGPIGDLDQPDGTRVTFPIHTALVYLTEGLANGQEIKIVYTGKVTNPKSGREFKAFELYLAVEGDAPADDSDLPF